MAKNIRETSEQRLRRYRDAVRNYNFILSDLTFSQRFSQAELDNKKAVLTWTTENPGLFQDLLLPRFIPDIADTLQHASSREKSHIETFAAYMLYTYLVLPLVMDGFGTNDSARDTWEKTVQNNHMLLGKPLIEENALRVNPMTDVFGSVEILLDTPENTERNDQTILQKGKLAPHPQQVLGMNTTLQTTIAQNDFYKQLPLEEKLAFVHSVRYLAAQALLAYTPPRLHPNFHPMHLIERTYMRLRATKIR
ncbi:hypothetical protein LRY65_05080 [Candidatus Woesebacteria bacterium]|nr:hypothetical protein [Candidatus Woesebacteria bacterium]MCD8506838.1 hypothetical protein [Candidatus Woesebacteria bacterium]MCD8527543.1 hypothetical protein [Candidatus Woesebacteria bacterium]MCD8546283.1 hypothetical protein [Candidatus Woesebacteria bacterium]